MGRGNPAFFMPESKVDRALIWEKAKDWQLDDELGWAGLGWAGLGWAT